MPKNERKIFEVLKYINYSNFKTPTFIKRYLDTVDTNSFYKSLPSSDSLSDVFETMKIKTISGSTSLINSSRIVIPKFIGDVMETFTPIKKRKIPKWKTERPSVSMEGMRIKTYQLLNAVKHADLNSSRLKRLEELLKHLLDYPETKQIIVKKGGIAILLGARTLANDNVTKEIANVILAALGYADPPKSSGIRILSIDGGGMRGLAVLQMLQMIEEISGQRIIDLFDFICGVSTGAIITCCLVPPNEMSIKRIAELYLELSRKVFNQSAIWGTGKLVWSHGYYDTSIWEKFLMDHVGNHDLIGTNRYLNCPKIAVVSTLINDSKVTPFVFRNYADPCYKASDYTGSHLHTMFQAVRASAAAPTVFEEFKTGHMLHQDGGIVVNNPAAIALHEARSLWPGEDINCIVSIGTGKITSSFFFEESGKKELAKLAKYTSWKQIFQTILQSATDTEVCMQCRSIKEYNLVDKFILDDLSGFKSLNLLNCSDHTKLVNIRIKPLLVIIEESKMTSASSLQEIDVLKCSMFNYAYYILNEGVHRILNDLLPDDTYFRLNPHLSHTVSMDEKNMDKLHSLAEDTKMYCRRNEGKFYDIVKKLTQKRTFVKKFKDLVVEQLKLSKITL